MATRLVHPLYQAIDANGDPGNGWKLAFYETGTVVLLDTYSDETLLVANANPVICNVEGRPANGAGDPVSIFGANKEDYKIILLDEDDNVIETKDPVDSITYNINSFDTRPAQHWGTTTGTAGAFLIKPDPSITVYSDDILFTMQMSLDNNAGSTVAVFQEGTVATYLTALDMMKYDNAGAKTALEAGDNQAGQTYIYRLDGTDAVCLNPGIPYINLQNNPPTTSQKGANYIDKYWLWGFVPTSGATSDEQVTITVGKALCQDGSTIVELTSVATDLDFPTLLGGGLANSTTYHLYRYLDDTDTMQWHLETSLTPTIADIKSALAYRRILSLKTDASGDLYKFAGHNVNIGIHIKRDALVNEYTSAPTNARVLITTSIPSGRKFKGDFVHSVITNAAGGKSHRLYSPDTTDGAVDINSATLVAGVGGDTSDVGCPIEEFVNISSQIAVRSAAADGTAVWGIRVRGFTDFRNYF